MRRLAAAAVLVCAGTIEEGLRGELVLKRIAQPALVAVAVAAELDSVELRVLQHVMLRLRRKVNTANCLGLPRIAMRLKRSCVL